MLFLRGTSPPDPLGFSALSLKSKDQKKKRATPIGRHPPFDSSPGRALGLLPSRALSSRLANPSMPWNPGIGNHESRNTTHDQDKLNFGAAGGESAAQREARAATP